MKNIWVTFQKEGIHKYPAALTDPELKAVDFLETFNQKIYKIYQRLIVRQVPLAQTNQL